MESISAPLVREEFESWVFSPMDAWPTPEDYATIIRDGVHEHCSRYPVGSCAGQQQLSNPCQTLCLLFMLVALVCLCTLPVERLGAGKCKAETLTCMLVLSGLPRVARLWTDYFLHYNFSVWLTPTTPVPATAIDNTEPWTEVRLRAPDLERVNYWTRTD